MSSSKIAAGGEPTNRRRRRLCVCTRIHQNNADRPVDMVKVREFLDTALLYADSIAIAVGSASPPSPTAADATADSLCPGQRPDSEHKAPAPQQPQQQEERQQEPSLLELISRAARDAEGEARSRGGAEGVVGAATGGADGRAVGAGDEDARTAAAVRVFEVAPWGKFTPALNALLGFAARDGAELVMFQSLETTMGKDAVSAMKARMEADDLVVGAALTGHEFRAGEAVELTGVTTPWNTLALWDVAKLARLGFLGVAEGLLPGVPAGVEEVTAIATLQALLGVERARAKLVRLPQVQWQAVWEDEGRRQWHESKMASKLDRAEKQMLALGIKKGLVHHLG